MNILTVQNKAKQKPGLDSLCSFVCFTVVKTSITKIYHFNYFLVDGSVVLNTFILLWNYHHHPCPELLDPVHFWFRAAVHCHKGLETCIPSPGAESISGRFFWRLPTLHSSSPRVDEWLSWWMIWEKTEIQPSLDILFHSSLPQDMHIFCSTDK